MINGETMVVLIVLIVGITRIARARYGVVRTGRGKEEMYVGPPRQDDPDTQRLRDDLRALKERVAVLERIATENDRGISLDREIEKLRSRD